MTQEGVYGQHPLYGIHFSLLLGVGPSPLEEAEYKLHMGFWRVSVTFSQILSLIHQS